jgi:hypothetical protein
MDTDVKMVGSEHELLLHDEGYHHAVSHVWQKKPPRRWWLYASVVQLGLVLLYTIISFAFIRSSTRCYSAPDIQGGLSLEVIRHYH